MRKKSQEISNLRTADRLTPSHDSQFSAFSTEVFDQMNRKHNHSSSPFTTLAEKMERKVASTGVGQPNYWPKTWFGADAYNAVFGTLKWTLRVFRLPIVEDIYMAWIEPLAIKVVPRCLCQFGCEVEEQIKK